VNYPSWPLIGSGEFVVYDRFISPRVLIFLVAPAFLGTVFTVLMLWFGSGGEDQGVRPTPTSEVL
jgi:hypothetical protein